MEVKMFATTGDISALEKELNAWLASRKVRVNTVKQSYSCDSGTCHALISVWFETLENITGI